MFVSVSKVRITQVKDAHLPIAEAQPSPRPDVRLPELLLRRVDELRPAVRVQSAVGKATPHRPEVAKVIISLYKITYILNFSLSA
jgi:hypothetical protein